jgi:hypothetical protein
MPGSPTNSTPWQQSYATVYDRTRVMSATSVVNIPLYNYHRSHRKHLGIYVGFEADGMVMVGVIIPSPNTLTFSQLKPMAQRRLGPTFVLWESMATIRGVDRGLKKVVLPGPFI